MHRAFLALFLVACSGKFTLDDGETPTDDVADTDVAGADTDGVDSDTDAVVDDTDTDVAADTDTDASGDTDPGTPTTDRCANQPDLDALAAGADTLEQTIQDCTLSCIGHRPLGQCVTRCLVAETDLSGGCSSCFGELIACVTNQCLSECIDPQSQDCTDCRAAKCDPRFETCAGVPIP